MNEASCLLIMSVFTGVLPVAYPLSVLRPAVKSIALTVGQVSVPAASTHISTSPGTYAPVTASTALVPVPVPSIPFVPAPALGALCLILLIFQSLS